MMTMLSTAPVCIRKGHQDGPQQGQPRLTVESQPTGEHVLEILNAERTTKYRQRNHGVLSCLTSVAAMAPLRGSCDNCGRRKTKCSGETPCSRCAHAGVQCTYSIKRKLGRPRISPRKEAGTALKKSRRPLLALTTDRPAFSPSAATGLAGLAESRFLSCFIQHFIPM